MNGKTHLVEVTYQVEVHEMTKERIEDEIFEVVDLNLGLSAEMLHLEITEVEA